EVRFVVNTLESRLARLHAIGKLTPYAPVPVRAKKNRQGAQTIGRIAAQRLSHRREAKSSGFILRENTRAGERTQKAMERPRFYPCRLRQLISRLSSFCEQISHTQLRRDRDRLRSHIPEDHR